jgi:hypothetical protein
LNGCRSAGVQSRTPEISTATQRQPLSRSEIMRLISTTKPYPAVLDCEPYGHDNWSRAISLAYMLQQAPPNVVSLAFRDYVVHTATAYDESTDSMLEWSKIHLLLRVMFELPDDENVERYWEMGWRNGGFGFADLYSLAALPLTPATPVQWKNDYPELAGGIANYFGADYRAADEYEFFLQRFPFRDLKNLVREKGG